jgi:hypothetical protein
MTRSRTNQIHGSGRGPLKRLRRVSPLAVVVLVAAAFAAPLTQTAAAEVPTAAPAARLAARPAPAAAGELARGPAGRLPAAAMKRMLANKLPEPKGAPSTSAVVAAADSPVDPIELRVLVLATRGDPNPNGIDATPAGSWDYNLSTFTDALDYTGVPYDVYKSTTQELCVNGSWRIPHAGNNTDSTCTSGEVTPWTNGVTADRLWDGGVHAYYQGVMQTNGTLSYGTATAFVPSALPAEQWAALWTFEAAFGIRTVMANTFPTADLGLVSAGEDGNPSSAGYTAAGRIAFPHVNGAGRLPISNAWTYRARVANPADTTTVPILTEANGNVLGAIHTYPTQGNRQALVLTFDSAGYQTHGQVLGYGLVNWVTKGLFLGQRHAILNAQPDDVLIEDSVWQTTTPCGTPADDVSLPEYRMTGVDLDRLVTWQRAKQAVPISRLLRLEMPFNGAGAQAGYATPDTLTPSVRRNQAQFNWVNHTFNHENLDSVDYATATSEISLNNTAATQLRFGSYNTANLIQPDISGLNNPEFLRAAKDLGVKYLISDTSRTGNPERYGKNEGRYNAFQPSILEMARYPVSLYFNVSTPAEWLAEDNCLYPAGAAFGHVDTYAQLLDREATTLVKYLLQGHNRPLMFHQPNLRAYSGNKSLLSDLLDLTFAKYSQLVTVPITSPTMNALGVQQANRMQYNEAWKTGGMQASIVPGVSITLKSAKAVTVPVTGLDAGAAYVRETYAGQRISYIPLAAGQSITLPLQ